MWVDKGIDFSNRSMKLLLQDNHVEIHPTHNKGKPVSAERFIKTIKNKICNYMISISKDVSISKSDEIVNKYNNYSTLRIT